MHNKICLYLFFCYSPELNFVVKDSLSLPALKQTLPGNRAAERRRRTQILRRGRMKLNPQDV